MNEATPYYEIEQNHTGGPTDAAWYSTMKFTSSEEAWKCMDLWTKMYKTIQFRWNPVYGEPPRPAPKAPSSILTSNKAARKAMPIARGAVDYFPRALAAVANVSFEATKQHHPGQEMHWDKGKSTDHADCIMRHLIERGTVDADGLRHSAKLAWRALALLEIELEKAQEKEQAK